MKKTFFTWFNVQAPRQCLLTTRVSWNTRTTCSWRARSQRHSTARRRAILPPSSPGTGTASLWPLPTTTRYRIGCFCRPGSCSFCAWFSPRPVDGARMLGRTTARLPTRWPVIVPSAAKRRCPLPVSFYNNTMRYSNALSTRVFLYNFNLAKPGKSGKLSCSG